jgi:hypothetical protein
MQLSAGASIIIIPDQCPLCAADRFGVVKAVKLVVADVMLNCLHPGGGVRGFGGRCRLQMWSAGNVYRESLLLVLP